MYVGFTDKFKKHMSCAVLFASSNHTPSFKSPVLLYHPSFQKYSSNKMINIFLTSSGHLSLSPISLPSGARMAVHFQVIQLHYCRSGWSSEVFPNHFSCHAYPPSVFHSVFMNSLPTASGPFQNTRRRQSHAQLPNQTLPRSKKNRLPLHTVWAMCDLFLFSSSSPPASCNVLW